MCADHRWETTTTETDYEGFNFEARTDHVTLPNGEEMDFNYLHESNAVAVLAFTDHGEVILVSEWRQTVKRYVRYGLPGGGIEPNETPEAAARRELREETGYAPASMERLFRSENSNGVTDGHHTFFLAHDCTKVGEVENPEAAEQTTVRTMSFNNVLSTALSGHLHDARTLLPVLFYAATNATN